MDLMDAMSDGLPAFGESDGEQELAAHHAEEQDMWEASFLEQQPPEEHTLDDAELPVAEPTASTCAAEPTASRTSSVNSGTPRQVDPSSPGSSTTASPRSFCAKRRRLRGKQPSSPPPVTRPCARLFPECATYHLHPHRKLFLALTSSDKKRQHTSLRQKKFRIVKKMKQGQLVACHQKSFSLPKRGKPDEAFWLEFESSFLEALADDPKLDSVTRGCAMDSLVSALDEIQKQLPDQKTVTSMKTRSLLLTYQAEWGLFDELSPPPTATVDDVVGLAKEHRPVQELFESCKVMYERLRSKRLIEQYAISMELCIGTWETTSQVRVHIHVWVLKQPNCGVPKQFEFRGRPGWINNSAVEFVGGRGSRSASAAYAGAFYVSCCKIGCVLWMSTLQPFKDYTVKDFWITTLFSQGKMRASDARKYYYMSVMRAEHNVRQLDCVQSYFDCVAEDRARESAEQLICSKEFGFRHVPEVSQWQEQYSHVKSRYKFLVLDGKSQTGKTRFAYSLLKSDPTGLSPPPSRKAVFYADCSSGMPDLRNFRQSDHKLLVLDELGPEGAVKLKKILQASNDVAVLGTSPTMQHVYKIRTWRTMIVVTTNVWAARLQGMPVADYEWLQANGVLVVVTEPLWKTS